MPRTNLRDQFDATERAAWKPRIVARNTFKFERDGETVIRLHGTDVVRRLPDGSAILNSNGWRTVTTKDRMNANMPAGAHLYSERGQWWISDCQWGREKRVAFFDGIQVPQCLDSAKSKAKSEREENAQKKLRAQIKRFVGKLAKLECLPEPSQGDCWFCCLRDASGKTMGQHGDDTGHILEHVREGYLHGSLIWNALVWAGYRDPAFIWQTENHYRARGDFKHADWARRALRRYLLRKLGCAS